MKRFVLMTAIIFFIVSNVFSQDGSETPIASDWTDVTYSNYSFGDQTFGMTIGVVFPLLFTDTNGDTLENNVNLGGAGSLSYNMFLTPHVFAGFEFGGMFAGTVGENMLYLIPMGLKIGYQFIAGRFEIPLSLMLGGATQTHLDKDYYGFFIKPQGSFFWRMNSSWSFGINAAAWIVPQTNTESEPKHDVWGYFLETTLSAKYHF